MSGLHQRIWKQQKASREFEQEALALQQDIGIRVPVRFLELRVRLLEKLVEETGGTLLTQNYRLLLADLKKAVVIRAEHLQLARRGTSLRVMRAP